MQNNTEEFFLISPDKTIYLIFKKLLKEKSSLIQFNEGKPAIDRILQTPPTLIILDIKIEDIPYMEMIKLIKGENVYLQIPLILCLDKDIPEEIENMSVFNLDIDDFLLRPINPKEAKIRLKLTTSKASKFLDANPLTKLPGNTTIIQKIQKLLDAKRDFALGYVDLDFFKSYNDKYGFSRGDEVLMMTARIIVNTVKEECGAEGFVGHIGGDDYVFIVPVNKAEDVCKKIIKNFDAIIPYFYDPTDKERGYIISKNRQGKIEKFPLMAVSIGVVFNINGRLKHYGEASQIAVNLKKIAKKSQKSTYIMDRRRNA
ncbi:GGDEF domain-containing response regulator [Desulfothermus sp.]